MKYLLTILSLSLLFSQELEVEGDLKVTGTMESPTIDSLQQVIANMQAQIDAMHADNQLETRVYELPRFNFNGVSEMELDLYTEIERLSQKLNEKDSVNIFLSEGAGLETIIAEMKFSSPSHGILRKNDDSLNIIEKIRG